MAFVLLQEIAGPYVGRNRNVNYQVKGRLEMDFTYHTFKNVSSEPLRWDYQ